jgi:hypothetical protein
MKNNWIIELIAQRNKEAHNSFGARTLANAWQHLPGCLKAAIDTYQQPGRLPGSKFNIQTGEDEIVVQQLIPFKAGAIITRNLQNCSILATYDDGDHREVTVAFHSVSLPKLQALTAFLVEPVLFPDLAKRNNLPRWESLEQSTRSRWQ